MDLAKNMLTQIPELLLEVNGHEELFVKNE